jgi:hypothetical protein
MGCFKWLGHGSANNTVSSEHCNEYAEMEEKKTSVRLINQLLQNVIIFQQSYKNLRSSKWIKIQKNNRGPTCLSTWTNLNTEVKVHNIQTENEASQQDPLKENNKLTCTIYDRIPYQKILLWIRIGSGFNKGPLDPYPDADSQSESGIQEGKNCPDK